MRSAGVLGQVLKHCGACLKPEDDKLLQNLGWAEADGSLPQGLRRPTATFDRQRHEARGIGLCCWSGSRTEVG